MTTEEEAALMNSGNEEVEPDDWFMEVWSIAHAAKAGNVWWMPLEPM